MYKYFFRYDYAILRSGKVDEQGTLFSQSPVSIDIHDLTVEAMQFLKTDDTCLLQIGEVQEIKPKEEYIKQGGSSGNIVTNYAL